MVEAINEGRKTIIYSTSNCILLIFLSNHVIFHGGFMRHITTNSIGQCLAFGRSRHTKVDKEGRFSFLGK